jgi:hypothetical protein
MIQSDLPLSLTPSDGPRLQGGSPGSDLRAAEELLDVNIWKSDPAELADSYHRIEARYPERLLLGIGSGHREATPGAGTPA